MFNLDVEPIHWEPIPIKDHIGWWYYGAMSESSILVDGKKYGIILRIWSQDGSLNFTHVPLKKFRFQHEYVYPEDDNELGGVTEGTLEALLNTAHIVYNNWLRLHNSRRFQLSAFCTMLNKLYAINHLDAEDAEEEGEE